MMKDIIKDVLEMPYYRNYAACSGKVHNVANHENAVEDILVNHGLSAVERKVAKAERDAWLAGETDDMEDSTYISQPCGTHDSPDFIIKDSGKLYFVECKSVKKGGTPVYNSGLPKDKYIYVFSSKKYDQTTVYLGRDVVEPGVLKTLKEMEKKIKDLCHQATQELREVVENTHGLGIYARSMFGHYGIKDKTDYFHNSRRRELEQNVLDFV